MRIERNHGAAIAAMVRNFFQDPLTTQLAIAAAAGISRERVRQWLKNVHGSSHKRRVSKRCGRSAASVLLLKSQFPQLASLSIEIVHGANNRLFRIKPTGRLVAVRECNLRTTGGKALYAVIQIPSDTAPDLILFTVPDKARVFVCPPYKPGIVRQQIPLTWLEPFEGRFDLLSA